MDILGYSLPKIDGNVKSYFEDWRHSPAKDASLTSELAQVDFEKEEWNADKHQENEIRYEKDAWKPK